MKSTLDFHPKFLASLASYSKEKFTKDLMAGIIVGIVALPLAIAFGIASGVSPEKAGLPEHLSLSCTALYKPTDWKDWR